jgi:hypothetical protein
VNSVLGASGAAGVNVMRHYVGQRQRSRDPTALRHAGRRGDHVGSSVNCTMSARSQH